MTTKKYNQITFDEIENFLRDKEEEQEALEKKVNDFSIEQSIEILTNYIEQHEPSINKMKAKSLKSYDEMTSLANKIEELNFKILDRTFDSDLSSSLKQNNFFSLMVELKDKDTAKTIFEVLKESSNHYFTEELLLTLPLYWKDISTINLEKYQEAKQEVAKLQEERTKLIDKFYKGHDRIIENNTALDNYKEIFFEIFPTNTLSNEQQSLLKDILQSGNIKATTTIPDENGEKKKVPLLLENKELFQILENFITLMNKSEISFEKVYQLAVKCESNYFVTFNRPNDDNSIIIEVKRERNYSSDKLDISKNEIKKLQDIIKELQKGMTKQEQAIIPLNTKYNFKDIASKTQSVSMYRPQKAIFLDGEKMKEMFEKEGSVSIPFGLMQENRKDLEFKFTKMNHQLSTTSQKIFNACCSAQYIMKENKYPIIETIIEDETLYQLWKGDKTFSKKPSSSELEQMKDEILGMSSNISKMNFSRNYDFIEEKVKTKYKIEGSFLPVIYKSVEIERENGQKYQKNCYIFTGTIPLFDFLQELEMVNTAPLEIESILKNSPMNDYISELMKEEIASLYYFKNKGKAKGSQKKVYISNDGEILSPTQWNIKKTKEGKLQGFWRYTSTRTIESLIEDYKKRTPNFEYKNKQRFIDSLVTFLRDSTQIEWKEGKWLESFILYDKKGNIVEDGDFITEKEKKEYKKSTGKKGKVVKNPSIDKISINIS